MLRREHCFQGFPSNSPDEIEEANMVGSIEAGFVGSIGDLQLESYKLNG